MKHLIDIIDLSVEDLDELIKTAMDIIESPDKYAEKCKRKKLATLFFEPSTRTRLSFEAAMYELGGNVLGFSEASSSSTSKGESVADTVHVVGCYADIIAMRHPKEGAPLVATTTAGVPIINAGDGGHHHPTQTLADLLTIYREMGTLEGLTIGMCGDLKYGRTVHSLIAAMSRYKGTKFVFISPDELKVPDYIITDILDEKKIPYEITTSLEESMPKLDILYMTRIQRERFFDIEEYNRLKDSYVLTAEKMALAKEKMAVLHPLPRVNEISVLVDADPRACYFKQALNGKYMRMSLILKLLGIAPFEKTDRNADENKSDKNKEISADIPVRIKGSIKCTNPRCITSCEQELTHEFKLADKKKKLYRCIYCDNEVQID